MQMVGHYLWNLLMMYNYIMNEINDLETIQVRK